MPTYTTTTRDLDRAKPEMQQFLHRHCVPLLIGADETFEFGSSVPLDLGQRVIDYRIRCADGNDARHRAVISRDS